MTVHDPYAVHPRKTLTPKQRLQLFVSCNGTCCVCGNRIDGVKEAWDEHIDPLWLNGTNDMSNRGVAHAKCARAKSAAETQDRAKGRKVAEKHFGAHRSRSPMPGSRKSKWKRKINGEVVPRG